MTHSALLQACLLGHAAAGCEGGTDGYDGLLPLALAVGREGEVPFAAAVPAAEGVTGEVSTGEVSPSSTDATRRVVSRSGLLVLSAAEAAVFAAASAK